jgi:hypothetical protein
MLLISSKSFSFLKKFLFFYHSGTSLKAKRFSLGQNFSKQDPNLLLFITRYEKVFQV